jgi:glucokinase
MFAGIDIGGSKIKGILTDQNGKELSFASINTPSSAKKIDEGVVNLIEALARGAAVSVKDIRAIGVGSPGPIDKKRGIILKAPNVPGFKNHPIVKSIEGHLSARVLLENDATVALIGSRWKVIGNRFRNWIMVTLGTGIGGGIVIDDKIYTGRSGNAMEIGHMTIEYNGRECACGARGCWERYASGPALIRMARERIRKRKDASFLTKKEPLTPLLIYKAALAGDRVALEIFEEYSTYLGIGIASLVNILNPEAVLFGGGVSRAHRFIFPVMKKTVRERALKGLKENIAYIPLKDPDRIPSFGAAKIAIDSFDQ